MGRKALRRSKRLKKQQDDLSESSTENETTNVNGERNLSSTAREGSDTTKFVSLETLSEGETNNNADVDVLADMVSKISASVANQIAISLSNAFSADFAKLTDAMTKLMPSNTVEQTQHHVDNTQLSPSKHLSTMPQMPNECGIDPPTTYIVADATLSSSNLMNTASVTFTSSVWPTTTAGVGTKTRSCSWEDLPWPPQFKNNKIKAMPTTDAFILTSPSPLSGAASTVAIAGTLCSTMPAAAWSSSLVMSQPIMSTSVSPSAGEIKTNTATVWSSSAQLGKDQTDKIHSTIMSPVISSDTQSFTAPSMYIPASISINSTSNHDIKALSSANLLSNQPTSSFGTSSYMIPSLNASSLGTVIMPPVGTYTHKLYELPTFSGQPEEWPLFYCNFVDSTKEFQYSDRQNLMRLQKCLTGEAKKAVTSMLIHPENVPNIIKELQFRFGRPQLLLQAQLLKLKQFPSVAGNKLEQVIDFSTEVKNVVAFLKSSGCHTYLVNPVLLDELIWKLPNAYRIEWSRYISNLPIEPTVADFSLWLDSLAKDISRVPGPPQKSMLVQPSTKQLMHVKESEEKRIICYFCDAEHVLPKCKDFENVPVSDRWSFAQKNRLCFSCLNKGHASRDCKIGSICGVNDCKRRHHRLLHDISVKSASEMKPVLNCRQPVSTSDMLFKILPVRLRGPNGFVETFAMFDDGSAITLIDSAVAAKLGLKGQTQPLSLQWYAEKTHTEMSKRVDVEIEGVHQSERFLLRGVRTVKNMKLPTQSFNKSDFLHLEHLPLQDYVNATPTILVGLDNIKLFTSTIVPEPETNTPIAVVTKLGWVVCGPTVYSDEKPNVVLHITAIPKDLHEIVHEYICMDSLGTNTPSTPLESDDDRIARLALENNTKRIGKRFETSLLWKEQTPNLPNSLVMAEQRLLGIDRKMKRDPVFAQKYQEAMNKYFEKGYARKLEDHEIDNFSNPVWYLPHFAVENVNKPGKIRIVFDAAAKVENKSLNSFLLKGPERAKPLLNILFRFRQGPVAVAADIKEMFSQIKIRTADQHAQRFLWWNEEQKIQHCIMTSMVFGAMCSPCCAEFVKNVNAREFYSLNPDAAAAIINNHYVDDFVMSFSDKNEATQLCKDVTKINAEGGFELRSFISNSLKLQNELNVSESSTELNMERQANHDKVLGMFWNTADDVFEFKTKFSRVPVDVVNGMRVPTKRELLGILMSIFDPFGLAADFAIHSKTMVQQTWIQKVGWDEPIPPALHKKWKLWWKQLERISEFKVKRCYSPRFLSAEIQLHVFVDASQEAYAAAAYFRVKYNETIDVTFVCGKTRTAPIKLMSIPRLELQAAVLGTRLSKLITDNHDVEAESITFWTDSRTVLFWIRSPMRKYKQFVGHRISEILSAANQSQWKWVSTDDNTADAATRSIGQPALNSSSKWLRGPDFLRQEEEKWPKFEENPGQAPLEEEIICQPILHCQVSALLIDFTKFSKYWKLKRIVTFFLRAVNNFLAKLPKSERQKLEGPLSATECQEAEKFICKIVQNDEYAEEMNILKAGKPIPKSSSLFALSPYVDEDGVIRAAGRLEAALCLPFSARRPILLPPHHYVTKLIMRNYHNAYHHQNNAVIINECRQRFWIPQAKARFKALQKECVICQQSRNKPFQPLMGPLPEDRITPYVRPFSYTGVDLFGPFNVTIGRRHEKRWAAIFTCLTTRAAHIELVENLSSDAFILCLNNFINRRGTPVRLRSDNGTNFIGAQRELSRANRAIDVDKLIDEATNRNIEWLFNCPANPSSGGCWERLIRIIKNLLAKTLAEVAPRVETLRAALIEAENILNSRPLTDIPLDFEDADPLTPNHFIGGLPNSTQTPYTEAEKNICLKKQWLIAQNLKICLWKRWIRDYLPQLLHRNKWHTTAQNLQVDDLVLIIEQNYINGKWPKGRIIKTFAAKDGQIRFVELKTSTGVIRRPANKLVKLFLETPNN